MAENNRGFITDRDLRPAYYDDFHCLAAGCRLSCCKGWNITFNKKDYLSLKRQKGSLELNTRLDGGVRRIRKGPQMEHFYGRFTMKNGVCPLLREDSLCQLQIEKGHEALPFVCRNYPRSEACLLSGYLERSLSPSCEGVLALLWDLPDGIEFRSDPLPKEQHRRTAPASKEPLALGFAAVREWCIDVLQNRRLSLPQRIWLMGLGLNDLVERETDVRRWIEKTAGLPGRVDLSAIPPSGNRELAMFLSNCLQTLLAVQIGDPNLLSVKKQILEELKLELNMDVGKITIPLTPYRQAQQRYQETFAEREYFMENLMVAVFFHLGMPHMDSVEDLWKSYVNFCNLYGIYRFLSVMSCREGGAGDREELFRMVVFASRTLIHNAKKRVELRDEFFQNNSATLAHMAILLSG